MPMTMVELERALRELRLSGMTATLAIRALQVSSHEMTFLDAFSWLVQDELDRRHSRRQERRRAISGLPAERKKLLGYAAAAALTLLFLNSFTSHCSCGSTGEAFGGIFVPDGLSVCF